MKTNMHITYSGLVVICFFAGWSLSEMTQAPISPQIQAPDSSQVMASKNMISCGPSNDIRSNSSVAPLSLEPESTRLRINSKSVSVAPPPKQIQEAFSCEKEEFSDDKENAMMAQKFNSDLAGLASKLGISTDESEIPELIANNQLYRTIEDQLIDASLDDADRLDFVEDYLEGYRRHVSVEFVSSLIDSAQHMDARDQVNLLEILQQQSIANRGSNRQAYQNTITEGIAKFKDSSDDSVRYATLLAMSEAVDDSEKLKSELEFFRNDSSDMVRAQALVITRQQDE